VTPTPIICRQVMSLLRSTLVSDTCTSTDGVGAGAPFGCIVTADDGIASGVSSSSESSLRLRSARGSPSTHLNKQMTREC